MLEHFLLLEHRQLSLTVTVCFLYLLPTEVQQETADNNCVDFGKLVLIERDELTH